LFVVVECIDQRVRSAASRVKGHYPRPQHIAIRRLVKTISRIYNTVVYQGRLYMRSGSTFKMLVETGLSVCLLYGTILHEWGNWCKIAPSKCTHVLLCYVHWCKIVPRVYQGSSGV